MTKWQENEKKGWDNAQCNGATLGAHKSVAAQRVSAATDALLDGDKAMDLLLSRRRNCTMESTAGYAAEVHHKVTFEADAALKGKHNIHVDIGPRGGNGSKGTADLIVTQGDTNVAEAGLKYRAKTVETTFDQSNAFDQGRQKICPSDQVDRVKDLASKRAKTGTLKAEDYADTAQNATDRLQYDGIESKPLSKKAAEELAKNGSTYSKDAFKMEMRVNTVNAVKMGATLGAVTSTVSNAVLCFKGEKSFTEGGKQVVADTVRSGMQSAAISAVTTGTKFAFIKAGAQTLAKGNAPMAIASTIVDAGGEIYGDIKKCRNGEVSKSKVAVNAVKHTGKAAAKTGGAMAGAQFGAAIGAVGGPPGLVVGGAAGGIVGYIASSNLVSRISNWF